MPRRKRSVQRRSNQQLDRRIDHKGAHPSNQRFQSQITTDKIQNQSAGSRQSVNSLFFQQQQKNCQQNPNRSVISRPTDEPHDLIQKITSDLLNSIQNRKFHRFFPFFFLLL